MCNTFKTVLIITAAAWQNITGNKHLSSISHGTSCCTGIGFNPDEDCRRNDADFTNPNEGCFLRDGRRLNGPLMMSLTRTDTHTTVGRVKNWKRALRITVISSRATARGEKCQMSILRCRAGYFRKAGCIVTDIFLFIFKFVRSVGIGAGGGTSARAVFAAVDLFCNVM